MLLFNLLIFCPDREEQLLLNEVRNMVEKGQDHLAKLAQIHCKQVMRERYAVSSVTDDDCMCQTDGGDWRINPIWGDGGGRIPLPYDFFDRSTLKDRKSGGHGVSKSKLLYWEDT